VLASYPAEGIYGSSVSSSIGLTALGTTTLTLTVTPSSSSFGQQVVLSATLTPYTAQGQSTDGEAIYFRNGTVNVGSGALSSGVATINLTSLPAGTDSLSAYYFGDTNLDASTSNTISYVVLGVPAITFTVANHTYGNAPFSIVATSNSTGALTYSVVSGPATIAGSTVTLTGAGAVVLQVSQAAASGYSATTKTASLTVSPAPLAVGVNNAARVFGAANPTFTGSVTGALNGDTFTETFSTTATTSSLVGIYPIVPAITGANIGNYTVTVTNGTLTVSQVGTATTFALSNQNTTLTANVVSLTNGVPTGSVGFYEGQTLVGTGVLANGVATYTSSPLPSGDVVVSAQYSGDANFTQSASPPILVVSVAPANPSLTVTQAGNVTDEVTISPVPGYVGTVQFSCANLPQASTCSFQPSTVAFTGTNNTASVSLTIQTGTSTQAALLFPSWTNGRWGTSLAAMIWLPGLLTMLVAGGRGRGLRLDKRLLLTLLLCGIGATLTACGGGSAVGGSSSTQTPAGTYPVQLVVSGSNGLSQNVNVQLVVQ